MEVPERVPDAHAGLTELLRAASSGDPAAGARVFALVGAELRRMAGGEAARWRGADARATALVHEVYLRLFGPAGRDTDWPNRRYFFAAAARAMHELMIEQQRRVGARHPPGPLPAESGMAAAKDGIPIDLIDLRLTLEALERVDARAAEVFRLRSLLEMTIEEVGKTLAISHGTVERDYRFARIWLRSKLFGWNDGRGSGARPSGNARAAGPAP